MSEWLEDVARGRRVAGALLTFAFASVVLCNFGPAPTITESAGAPLLDVRFGGGAAEAHAFLAALEEQGRELYAIDLVLDSAYRRSGSSSLAHERSDAASVTTGQPC